MTTAPPPDHACCPHGMPLTAPHCQACDDLRDGIDEQPAADHPPLNPDCVAGKHDACSGTAWHDGDDCLVMCGCPCHRPDVHNG